QCADLRKHVCLPGVNSASARRLAPGARFEEVKAGHMVAGDDNDVFTAHLVDFLDRDVSR
ncbi:hypothetical protein ABT279_51065, partial [Amycolatopsis sp. NPDC000673]